MNISGLGNRRKYSQSINNGLLLTIFPFFFLHNRKTLNITPYRSPPPHLLFESTPYSRRSARRESGGQLPPGQTSWGAPRQVKYTVFPVKISCLRRYLFQGALSGTAYASKSRLLTVRSCTFP